MGGLRAMEFVSTRIESGIAEVTLKRPDGRNTLNQNTLEELRDTARHLADQPSLAAVILHGDPVFSAGAQIDSGDAEAMASMSALEVRHAFNLGPEMCKAWEQLEAYTIGAIEGYCIGGGAALAAALDYRIAGESAFFRLPEVSLGINMSWQTIPRLVAQVGLARAKEYAIFGRRVPAQQALSWGLCEQLEADGQTLTAARTLAAEVGQLPPIPVRMTKAAANAAGYALSEATSFMDRDQFLYAAQTEDYREAVQAFMEKRKPKFTGN